MTDQEFARAESALNAELDAEFRRRRLRNTRIVGTPDQIEALVAALRLIAIDSREAFA